MEYNSDKFLKDQGKILKWALLIGVVLIGVHVLTVLKVLPVFDSPKETRGMFYFGLFLTALSLLRVTFLDKSIQKNRTTYTIENGILNIVGPNIRLNHEIVIADNIFKSKITRANFGTIVTCELRLQDRAKKKKKIICALDENSFRSLVRDIESAQVGSSSSEQKL